MVWALWLRRLEKGNHCGKKQKNRKHKARQVVFLHCTVRVNGGVVMGRLIIVFLLSSNCAGFSGGQYFDGVFPRCLEPENSNSELTGDCHSFLFSGKSRYVGHEQIFGD